MVSWSTVQTLVLFLGPIVVPRLLAFYRSLRAPSNIAPIPLSTTTSLSLNLLLVSALLALASTLPFLSPPNIFYQTQSRLQTPTGVLFTRLTNLRSSLTLSPSESRLQTAFENGGLEARLLYLRFGPDVLSNCVFVDPKAIGAEGTYLLFLLPGLAVVHVAHMLVLGVVTSSSLTGTDGGRWRTLAMVAGVVVGVAEMYAFWSYDHRVNARATRLAETEFWYWKVRLIRGLVIAAVDGALGWLIWLGATRRAFLAPIGGAEKVEIMTKGTEGVLGKLRGLGTVRNVVYRSSGMRGNVERYWVREEQVTRSVLEERDVVRAMTDVLSNTDMGRLQAEADSYVNAMLPEA